MAWQEPCMVDRLLLLAVYIIEMILMGMPPLLSSGLQRPPVSGNGLWPLAAGCQLY